MIIRKNTKAFKTIHQIVTACKDRADRNKLIRLYITRGGHSIRDRINVEGIESDPEFFYNMNYQAVIDNLNSPDRQLNMSDDNPGIYFFHSSSNKVWDETPFEFDKAIEHEFSGLPDLPVARRKEKVEKVSIPSVPGVKSTSVSKKKSKPKEVAVRESPRTARQPTYKLKHEIQFSTLDDVVFRNPDIRKRDVLDFYYKIADLLLPYIKDRPLPNVAKQFNLRRDQAPEWIRYIDLDGIQTPLCNDKDHLLFLVEIGCLEFCAGLSRIKSIGHPDYAILSLDYDESDLSSAAEVAQDIHDVLEGLALPSFVKTAPPSAFHIYIPLDAKSNFEYGRKMAESICRLVKLKLGDGIVLDGIDKRDYGKIVLSYARNEQDQVVLAPYSLTSTSPVVATPLSWKEITADLNPDVFTPDAVQKRIRHAGDLFRAISKNSVNAKDVLKRLDKNYSFLF